MDPLAICQAATKDELSALLHHLTHPNVTNDRGDNLVHSYIRYYITDDCEDDDQWAVEKVKMLLEKGVSADLPNGQHETAIQLLEGMESACSMCENWQLIRLLHQYSKKK
jgi:hypothetical protein